MRLDIHCIDLTKYSLTNIKAIADENTLEDVDLYSFKKKGCNKVWLDIKTLSIIAIANPRKNKKDHISLTKIFHDRIISMSSYVDSSVFEPKVRDCEIELIKFDLSKKLDIVKPVCEKLNIDYNWLVENKNGQITKMWITDCNKSLFYESFGGHPIPAPQLEEIFLSRPEWELRIPKNVEVVVDKKKVVLEIDHILDKISAYGINALCKEEKDFLHSLYN